MAFATFVSNNRLWVCGGRAHEGSSTAVYKNDVWSTADGVHWDTVTGSAAWTPNWFIEGADWNDAIWLNSVIWPTSNEIWRSPTLLTDGLVAYYPFDSNANDASGNGNNGTVTGAAFTAGRIGQSILFHDSALDLVTVPHSSSLDITNALTVALWLSPSQNQADDYPTLVSKGNDGVAAQFQLSLGPQLQPRFQGALANTHLARGTWQHVAVTYEGGICTFYVNGALDSETSCVAPVHTIGALLLGRINYQTWPHKWMYAGGMDDLRIYNRALSAAEVQALYNVGSGQPTLSNVRASQRAGTNLVDVWYDLSGATAPVIVSVSISTNGGVSYPLQPAHLTGDGVTAPVGSRSGLHLVWDAGADWPGRYSTQMRVLVSVPPGGGNAQANSPMFALDTRSALTGTITGRVLGNGSPLANARVQVRDTCFGTTSISSGTFTLAGLPPGRGYVLDVSAANYSSQSAYFVNVLPGVVTPLDHDINLAPQVCTALRIEPLTPDVNPAISTVEEGGTAFRYYQVESPGVPGVPQKTVTVEVDGINIPQTNSQYLSS